MEPTVAIIGGSGIGDRFAATEGAETLRLDTPFGPPSDAVVAARVGNIRTLSLNRHGPGHLLNPSCVPYRANIFALKQVGATRIIATGATGSLREDIKPGDLVICDQVIDKTFRRPGSFYDGVAAVHVEFANPFCPLLRKALLDAAADTDLKAHSAGTYVCMEGPQFSTRAESNLHRNRGGDLIGMTCMPEAKLAREAEMCYALIALPTDYDCWKPHEPSTDKTGLLDEIIGNLNKAGDAARTLIDAVLERLSTEQPAPCDCHRALQLAIWSDKSAIDPAEIERLKPLWGTYFPDQQC